MGAGMFIAGGLLKGVGSGMVAEAERLRLEALEATRREQAIADRQDERTWQGERDALNDNRAADRERQRDERAAARERERETREAERRKADDERRAGEIGWLDTDEEGNRVGVTRRGEKKNLGYRYGPTGTRDGKRGLLGGADGADGDEVGGLEMSESEARIYREIKGRYTDPNRGNAVDWTGLIAHLREMPEERGGRRWNEIADYLSGSVGAYMTAGEATEEASREADGRGGWFGEGYPETGGDREAFVARRAGELRTGGKGGQGSQAGRGSIQRPPQDGAKASQSPPGGGTRDNPYKATTQAHIDWFKENAPEGAIIEANGQLFRK
jgi:hypothetical protein